MTKAAENSFKMLIKVQRQLEKQQNKENRQYNMRQTIQTQCFIYDPHPCFVKWKLILRIVPN